MPKLKEIARIGNKPIYKDRNGNICTETNGFQFLRGLTAEESRELMKSRASLLPAVLPAKRGDI